MNVTQKFVKLDNLRTAFSNYLPYQKQLGFLSLKVDLLNYLYLEINMPLNRELSDFEWGRIIGQWECGKKTREIADALGHTQSQVTRAINAFRDKQQVTVQPRSGRPRSMSDRN